MKPSISPIQTVKTWLKGTANQLLSHTPLVLMALLALGSFIMFKQAPSTAQEAIPEAASQQDDYFLKHFVITEFSPTGAAKLQISGNSAQHNPISKVLLVNQVAFSTQTQNGNYRGSAQSGKITDDGKLVILQGDAIVDKTTSSAGQKMHVTSEQITVRQNPDTVQASAPVRMYNDKAQMAAESLLYDGASKVTQLNGRVRMVIEGK